jgi:hypothetical protein
MEYVRNRIAELTTINRMTLTSKLQGIGALDGTTG